MLRLQDIVYRIEGRAILTGASAHAPQGARIGLVGRNGSGKTTLFRLIEGEIAPESGVIAIRRGARVGTVAQEAPAGAASLIATVLAADKERAALLAEAENAEEPSRIAEIHERLAMIEAHSAEARASAILAGLGFPPETQARPCAELSGGWRMRVALAAALFAAPDLLLLDEPTNYLDLEGALWLEQFLRDYPRTVIVISHDRDLLNRAVRHILHLEDGRLTLYAGNYDDFERMRRERLMLQESMRKRQEAQRAHMQAFVDRFRYKASKARQAQSRLKALARMEPIPALLEARIPPFAFPSPREIAPPLLTAERVALGYAEDKPVLRGVNLRLDPDDRIALLGANGEGKSTLAKMIAGRLQPLSGAVTRAPKLKVGFFAQHQLDELRAGESAVAHLARLMPRASEAEVRARAGYFGFTADKADTLAGDLSGGEKARLLFALAAFEAPQILILDEPTNHLDIEAREALAQALAEYRGAVVLISHDSHLVETTAEALWLIKDGAVAPFDGDIADYRRLLLSRGREGPAKAKAENGSQSAKDRRKAAAGLRAELAPLRKALAAAETRIAKAEAERDRLEAALGDPKLYQGDPTRLARLTQEAGRARAALNAAETDWIAAQEALDEAEAARNGARANQIPA